MDVCLDENGNNCSSIGDFYFAKKKRKKKSLSSDISALE